MDSKEMTTTALKFGPLHLRLSQCSNNFGELKKQSLATKEVKMAEYFTDKRFLEIEAMPGSGYKAWKEQQNPTMKRNDRMKHLLQVMLASLALWVFAQAAGAADLEQERCPDAIVESVGKFFRLDHFSYPQSGYYPSVENDGLIVAGVCKPMPNDASRVIAAFAYDAKVEYEKKLLLVVYDNTRKRVISSYSDILADDDPATKVGPYSIKIDTARYVLTENTRAFGLRLNTRSGRNCGDVTSGDELTLYVMEGRKLRPVFFATMRRGLLGRAGSAEVMGGCGFNMEIDSEKTISIEKTATHGFADIRLTAKVTWGFLSPDEPPATDPNSPKPLSRIIKYDGKRYAYNPRDRTLDDDIDDAMGKLFQEIRKMHGE
jgi:hypothetical protein